jgi:translation initiation factor 5B
LPEAKEEAERLEIPIFKNDVVYRLAEEYEEWVKQKTEEEKKRTISSVVLPAKIKLLPGYVFRRSHPVIVGVEVLAGKVKSKTDLINENGEEIGEIAQIQDEGKTVSQASKGAQVAISIRGNVLVGRQINEGDILYANIPEQDIRIMRTRLEAELSSDDLQILSEFIEIKRKKNPVFAF